MSSIICLRVRRVARDFAGAAEAEAVAVAGERDLERVAERGLFAAGT